MPTHNDSADQYADYIDCSQFMQTEALKNLTSDELYQVTSALTEFQDCRFHPDVGDTMFRAVAAAALCNFASRLLMEALDPDSETDDDKVEISNEAIWASRKSIDLYPHPLLFGRLARFLEATGWRNDASKIRDVQKNQQSTWVPKRADELLMIRLDDDTWLDEA